MIELSGFARNILLAELADENGKTELIPILEVKLGLRENQFAGEYKYETVSFVVAESQILGLAGYLIDAHKELLERFVDEKESNENA